MNHLDTFQLEFAGNEWTFDCTMGKFAVGFFEGTTTPTPLIQNFRFVTKKGGGFDREIPPAFDSLFFDEVFYYRAWMFALWFLMLLFAVPWLLFLAWRWRRIHSHQGLEGSEN